MPVFKTHANADILCPDKVEKRASITPDRLIRDKCHDSVTLEVSQLVTQLLLQLDRDRHKMCKTVYSINIVTSMFILVFLQKTLTGPFKKTMNHSQITTENITKTPRNMLLI